MSGKSGGGRGGAGSSKGTGSRTGSKSVGAKPKQTPGGAGKPKGASGGGSRAVVPRGSRAAAVPQQGRNSEQRILVPEGYTVRKVEPAKNYDVVSFARAMNPDFGPRVKKLFDTEREAAIEAQQTGIYIGWRCPEFKHDCQRVGSTSKCFCGHLLNEHARYSGKSVLVPCRQGCRCKGFAWIPSKPEEIGEFWFQRRRDFDPSSWRAKCRCKHTHEQHDPTGIRRCKACGCGAFDSNFLCAACDRHWEEHETVFETASMRQQNGFPVGADYLPFAEIPSLRNMVLTGEDDGDMSYMALTQGQQALPSNQPADNSTVVPFGSSGGRGRSKGGFRPVYD